MKVVRQQDGREIFTPVHSAESFSHRLFGLMGQKSIRYGLYFKGSNWIHTLFMKSAIDVVYLNKSGTVTRVAHQMKPWSLGPIVFSARSVLELPPGRAQEVQLQPGDVLHVGT